MNQLTLDVFPSFITSCSFQLEATEAGYLFSFQKRTFPNINEEAVALSITLPYSDELKNIEALGATVVRQALQDQRLILDGVSLACTVTRNGISCEHKYRCPKPGDSEYVLIAQLVNLAQKYFHHPLFVNYMELLEGYFFSNPCPVKLFDESPFRMRIYGSLSIYEKEALEKIILEHATKEELIIDMSNLQGMGTALYECFMPLRRVSKLSFLANKAAVKQLKEMGFEDALVRAV
jgi:anti-anti-sigma regulatory factor